MNNFQQNQITIRDQTFELLDFSDRYPEEGDYKGRSTQTGEIVRIRIKNSSFQREQQIFQFLNKEPKSNLIGVKGIEKLQNEKILLILEWFDDDLYSYMQEQEYKDFLKVKKNQLFQQVLLAVRDLYDLGYIHRDLKPENFAVIKTSVPVIIKLNIFESCIELNQSIKTKNIGTSFYNAPEILNSQSTYDNSVDAWALGCLWFEMVTGKTFFEGNSKHSVENQIITFTQSQIIDRIKQFNEFDDNEKSLIMQLLQKDSKNRLSVKDLIKSLIPPLFQGPLFQSQFKFASQFEQFSNPSFSNEMNVKRFNTPQSNQFINYNQNQPQYNIVNQVLTQDQPYLNLQFLNQTKTKFENLRATQIEKIKRDEDQNQQQQLMQFKQGQKLEQNLKLQEKENQFKQIHNEILRKTQDKVELEKLKLEQQIQIRNQLEKENKLLQQDMKRKYQEYEKQLQYEMEVKVKNLLIQKEQEIQQRAYQEIQQYLLIASQEKQRKEELELQQQFNEMKNKAQRLIENVTDLTEKFIQNLKEKQQGPQSSLSFNNLQMEYDNLISNYIEQFTKKLKLIKQDEIRLSQINQYHEINEARKIEQQYSYQFASIIFQQSNIQNEIGKKQKQMEEFLQSQKLKKEQIDQQINQLKQQLQEKKKMQENYFIQIQNQIGEFQKSLFNIDLQVTQFQEERYFTKANGIKYSFYQIQKYVKQMQQQLTNSFQFQPLKDQIDQTDKQTEQLSKYQFELSHLLKQKNRLIEELNDFNREQRCEAQDQLEQFKKEALKYQQELNGYQSQKQQSQQQLSNLQWAIVKYNVELENLKKLLNSNTIIKKQEFSRQIDLLTQLHKDLQYKDIQLKNRIEELNRIKINQETLDHLQQKAFEIIENKKNSKQFLFQQFDQYSNISNAIEEQIQQLKKNYDDMLEECETGINELKSQIFEITVQNQEKQVQEYNCLIENLKQKLREKEDEFNNLLIKLNEIKKVQDQKQIIYNQFTSEINQVKQIVRNLNFSQNFEIYNQILQYKIKNEGKLKQFEQYFERSCQLFNQNQELYYELKKDLNANEFFQFELQKVYDQLDRLYKRSQEKKQHLDQFYKFIQEYCQQIEFKGSQEEHQEVNENWQKTKQIQSKIKQLKKLVNDSYARSQTDQSSTQEQDCINLIQQNLQELTQMKLELQAINQNQIDKFNECLQQNFESLVVQIMVIITFSIYLITGYHQRRFHPKEGKMSNASTLQKDQQQQFQLKTQLEKYQNIMERKQFQKQNIEELIQEQNLMEERQETLLKEINTRNEEKLRSYIKNPQTITDIIDLGEHQDFYPLFVFRILINV